MKDQHSNITTGPESTAESEQEPDAQPASIIALRILEALAAASTDVGVTAIANQLGIAKPRVYRHLSALRDYGYVTQNQANSQYSISWRFYLLGQQIARKFNLTAIARPVMQALSDAIGHTVVVSTFNETETVILDYIRGSVSGLEIGLRPGARFALNKVAQGKVVLAFGPEALARAFFAQPHEAGFDAAKLRAEIALTATRGWADAPGQLFSGINAIAAPIFAADNTLLGCIAVVGSVDYIPSPPEPSLLAAVLEAATRISHALGRPQEP